MTNKSLLLQDFGLSTFAQDIFNSTSSQDKVQKEEEEESKKESHFTLNTDDNDDDDDDDDIPLSNILDQSIPSSKKNPFSQSAPPSRRPSQMTNIIPTTTVLKATSQQPYSILEDDSLHEDDDEDLVPIAVLQDPTIKLRHPFQSAAEKYKNSVLCRDPQLKVMTQKEQLDTTTSDYDRRSSLDPLVRHHSTSSPISSPTYFHPSVHPVVMRSVSTNCSPQPYETKGNNYSSNKSQEMNNLDDDDDDVPLFQTCLGAPSSIQTSSSNVKVTMQQ
ncbi:uncharacterized protein BX664DRAFT_331446 [Halteromyces radiatus]|uniref:uncharacterized protein n=1 Tax=Halteromyces radiatus TaxID=101107 RepID=UPI00221F0F28|nr:uncharacterized protein BX664DRAFT_331446 [Halteromyces radiatus]KAI8088814.1 hypothetical protein BX664DRAFT_331446 [Halteromyces radiatus]